MNNYKKILPYAIYAVVLLLASFGESFLQGHYFALGVLMALAYKRKNLLIILPMFALFVALAQWSIEGLLYSILPVAVVLCSQLVCYRIKRPPSLMLYNVMTLVLSLTSFLFISYDIWSIVRAALSVVSSVLVLNVVGVGMTAIETRGAKWKLSRVEWLAIVLMLVLLVVAVTPIEVSGFFILPIVATFVISLSVAAGPLVAIVVGGLVGLTASIVGSTPHLVAIYFVYALGVVVARVHPGMSAVVGTALFVGIDYYLTRQVLYLEWIGAGAGSLLTVLLYRLLSPRFASITEAQSRSQSSRLIINRTRQEVGKKLETLAGVFKDMEEVLGMSSEAEGKLTPERITKTVQSENCALCAKRKVCEKSLGGSMAALISDMVRSALERGKASILDTPPFLSANCSRLSGLIDSVNWHVAEVDVQKTRAHNNQLIRDVMSRQMGGVGDILRELSSDVALPVNYDTTTEKHLVSELNYRNCLATDAIVLPSASGSALTLQLAEDPSDEVELKATISRIMGARMCETVRERNVLGGVTITYEASPRYNVTYGEYSLALEEDSHCGDSIEATHISTSKVMIILSDGMGSGRAAYDTSRLAIDLLTSFYKAGFSHDTVLYSSSRLLTLKGEDDCNAVDLALVDLVDGAVDFIKLGGREGYVKTISGVDVVPCGSLPLGIVDEVVPVVTRRKLSDGDCFVMVSDGVADILSREHMQEILSALVTSNPSIIAKEVVDNALRLGGKKDDMSCVVGRIFLAV